MKNTKFNAKVKSIIDINANNVFGVTVELLNTKAIKKTFVSKTEIHKYIVGTLVNFIANGSYFGDTIVSLRQANSFVSDGMITTEELNNINIIDVEKKIKERFDFDTSNLFMWLLNPNKDITELTNPSLYILEYNDKYKIIAKNKTNIEDYTEMFLKHKIQFLDWDFVNTFNLLTKEEYKILLEKYPVKQYKKIKFI